MAAIIDAIGMSDPLKQARPIKVKLSNVAERNETSDSDKRQPTTMVEATDTTSFPTDMAKLESDAIRQPTTSTLNSSTNTDEQTATNSTHVDLHGSIRARTLEPGLNAIGAELLNTVRHDAGDHWNNHHTCAQSTLEYAQFKRPSPEQISSIFPSELPSRPLPKRSFLQGLVDLPTRLKRRARTDEGASNEYAFHTQDIDLGASSESRCSHDADRLRRLKFWSLMLVGVVLSMAIGVLIYHLVRHNEEDYMN